MDTDLVERKLRLKQSNDHFAGYLSGSGATRWIRANSWQSCGSRGRSPHRICVHR